MLNEHEHRKWCPTAILILIAPEMMHATEGKECLLAIHSGGDIFGEFVVIRHRYALVKRHGNENDYLKAVACAQFFALLSRASLFEELVRYLAVRVADQQQVIANLVTEDSEQRLGQTWLQLARTMNKKDPNSIRIELRISNQELSEMIGTTRPRINLFMQRFHHLGLGIANEE